MSKRQIRELKKTIEAQHNDILALNLDLMREDDHRQKKIEKSLDKLKKKNQLEIVLKIGLLGYISYTIIQTGTISFSSIIDILNIFS